MSNTQTPNSTVDSEITPDDDWAINTVKILNFGVNQRAEAIRVNPETNADEILQKLQLDGSNNALITVSGGAGKINLDDEKLSRLSQLCSRGIAAAAAEIGADLIDGGTASGIMQMMGKGVVDRGRRSRLIGISPEPLTQYPNKKLNKKQAALNPDEITDLDPNHSHFVLVDSDEWGGETETSYRVAEALSRQTPTVTVLINGGEIACDEVLRSVRNGWPVIIVEGSGRLADELSELSKEPPDFICDPRKAEIVSDGRLYIFPLEGNLNKKVAEIQRLIRRQLRGDSTLRQAWERFAVYDANANRQQDSFRRIQMWILVLTVLGTGLVVVQSTLDKHVILSGVYKQTLIETRCLWGKYDPQKDTIKTAKDKAVYEQVLQQQYVPIIPLLGSQTPQECSSNSVWKKMVTFSQNVFVQNQGLFEFITNLLRNIIILIPILITALLAAANRFNAGTKWLLLRGSAEAVKQEIFRYRAYAEIYSDSATKERSRESKLASKLKSINNQLIQTEVNLSAFRAYEGVYPPLWSTAPKDEGFSRLSPEQYLAYRLEDQHKYYINKSSKLEKRLHRLQWMIYIFGGIGTLLAAMGLELWIALTSALVAALGGYLEYQQIENTLLKYNKASSELADIRSWWTALSAAEQERQENIDTLIGMTERTLHSEFSGWAQEMQDTLSALREEQEKRLRNLKEQDEEKNSGNKKQAASKKTPLMSSENKTTQRVDNSAKTPPNIN